MSRTLAIGDIHGGLKGLQQVLDKAQVTPEDHLIFLGDYVDGWSDSVATVSYLIALEKRLRCTFIRGNHDDLVYQYIQGKPLSSKWIEHGGQVSKDGYDMLPPEEKTTHIDFYTRLQDYYVDAKNRMYCHAGFQNQNGPEAEWHSTAFYWDRTLWEAACALDPTISKNSPLYPKRLTLFTEIYIGHTPVTRLGETTPVQKGNVWNIDTGAAFQGPISIIDVDTKQLWQSDPIWLLYPKETGRNPFSFQETSVQKS